MKHLLIIPALFLTSHQSVLPIHAMPDDREPFATNTACQAVCPLVLADWETAPCDKTEIGNCMCPFPLDNYCTIQCSDVGTWQLMCPRGVLPGGDNGSTAIDNEDDLDEKSRDANGNEGNQDATSNEGNQDATSNEDDGANNNIGDAAKIDEGEQVTVDPPESVGGTTNTGFGFNFLPNVLVSFCATAAIGGNLF